MFSAATTAQIAGIRAARVTVEVDVSDGLPSFVMVGNLSSEVRDAQDRVRTALKNMGISLPPRRITVNMAPGDIRKSGAGYDLPIAAAVLGAIEVIQASSLEGILFAGELGLGGAIRPIRGILEIVSCASAFGCHTCIIPIDNLAEGSAINDVTVLGAGSLCDVIRYLGGYGELARTSINIEEIARRQALTMAADFKDLKGQLCARRAAEIAVTGFHNLLLTGPPGAGKTMIASRMPSILPPMTREEILEVSRIHSIAGCLPPGQGLLAVRPFRSPHHTITPAGLTGGGLYPGPGEISLAHRGVLFLDELPEFSSASLEILRQPMEEGIVHITRTTGSYTFPAAFMLVAASNPCKCGFYPDRTRCRCTESEVLQYQRKISRPLLDRIDLCVEVQEASFDELSEGEEGESSAGILRRVMQGKKMQEDRFQGTGYTCNAHLDVTGVEKYCALGPAEKTLMEKIYHKLNLTGRSYHKMLKVARTIADLDGSDRIEGEHLTEAAVYRVEGKRSISFTEKAGRRRGGIYKRKGKQTQ